MSTYRGIAFPFRKGTTSFPEVSEDSALIKQSILQIVLTQRGERVMRPDFGSNVMQCVFENNTETLADQIQMEVLTAVAKHEPRAIVRSVDVDQEENEIVISISFVVRATREQAVTALAIPRP